MEDTRPLAIALMGPTASGKTALAVEWAERLGTEIISVDSALVYRGLDIGSAKPSGHERALHRLVDIREPHEPYSAAQFAVDALAAMREITDAGRVPLLCGGTGLYFCALFEGLSAMPEADVSTRAGLTAEAAERGWPALHAELARVDPLAATRIHASDTQRITRALEVHRLTGRSISDWQEGDAAHRLFPFRLLKLVLAPEDRAVLHERIALRFEQMLSAGFLDEVRRLIADPQLRDVDRPRDLPSMRAVGYRQAWSHLVGEIDATTFRAQAVAATRQLAKRQFTWLRREHDARWLDPMRQRDELETALGLFLGTGALATDRRAM